MCVCVCVCVSLVTPSSCMLLSQLTTTSFDLVAVTRFTCVTNHPAIQRSLLSSAALSLQIQIACWLPLLLSICKRPFFCFPFIFYHRASEYFFLFFNCRSFVCFPVVHLCVVVPSCIASSQSVVLCFIEPIVGGMGPGASSLRDC